MNLSVETDDLRSISATFGRASTEVGQLRTMLASQAAGPESQDVVGSTAAAAQYTQTLQEWTRALDRLATALETMTRKMSTTADHYESTEQANTVQADSAGGSA
jgi:WXG100 family type VII secretion target